MLTLEELNVSGKTVLCRMDFNEPIDKNTGELQDTTRIDASLSTIEMLISNQAKIVILTHQGSDIEYQNFYSTYPHYEYLKSRVKCEVSFVADICGPEAIKQIKKMPPQSILFLENVRFMSEEQTLFELSLQLTVDQQLKTQVVEKLAPIIDVYVNDAFSAAHRNQPSLCAFAYIKKSAMGKLFEKEYKALSLVMSGEFNRKLYILGGAKVNDAFMIIENVLNKDRNSKVLVGGLVGNIFIDAKFSHAYSKNASFIKERGFEQNVLDAKKLISLYSNRIIVPVDVAYIKDNQRFEHNLDNKIIDELFTDIGTNTISKYINEINHSDLIFVNGPMGVFENDLTDKGTKNLWTALTQCKGYTVLGGGDSITAVNKFAKSTDYDYISTAGGAMIQFLAGKSLPAIEALKESERLFNENI